MSDMAFLSRWLLEISIAVFLSEVRHAAKTESRVPKVSIKLKVRHVRSNEPWEWNKTGQRLQKGRYFK